MERLSRCNAFWLSAYMIQLCAGFHETWEETNRSTKPLRRDRHRSRDTFSAVSPVCHDNVMEFKRYSAAILANQTETAIAVTQTQRALYSLLGQATLHAVL